LVFTSKIGEAELVGRPLAIGKPGDATYHIGDLLMRTLVSSVVALGAVALLAGTGLFGAADEKPKYTIKEVMKKAHSGDPKLCAKVAGGKASKEEKEELVTLYTALTGNKPPRGDEGDWKERTQALVTAAKACLADDKEGPGKLKKAVDCKGCHELHKGKK
jgi:hypothetical protein